MLQRVDAPVHAEFRDRRYPAIRKSGKQVRRSAGARPCGLDKDRGQNCACAHPFTGEAEVEEFDYFMIRVRRPAADALERIVCGVAERLGTGEKRSFATGEELLRFVCGECGHAGNMQSRATSGKSEGCYGMR